jgi:hypothetical protein
MPTLHTIPPRITAASKVCAWIEEHCRVPEGPEMGEKVRLSPEQRDILQLLYDDPEGPAYEVTVRGALAAYVALAQLCSNRRLPHVVIDVDLATVWSAAAASPTLRDYFKRDGDHIICPDRGTKYPVAA